MYDHYAGLIFDMDGTLLNTEPLHQQAWQQTLERHGRLFDKKLIVGLSGSPVLNIAKVITEYHSISCSPDQLAAEKTANFKALLAGGVSILPLVDVVKEYYQKRPMAVGTGSERAIAEMLLESSGIRDYFNVVVCADDVSQHKPEPETFLRCAQLPGVKPDKCVVFEDADFGIYAAQAAGMDVVDIRLL